MSAGDIFGLVASVLVFAYLIYALFRGESSGDRHRHRSRSSSSRSLLIVARRIPLGLYMARVYDGTLRLPRWLGAPERGFYRLSARRAAASRTGRPTRRRR